MLANAVVLINAGAEIEGSRIWGSPVTSLYTARLNSVSQKIVDSFMCRFLNTGVLVIHSPPYGILVCAPGSEVQAVACMSRSNEFWSYVESGTMSHIHFCDYAGHEWKCNGIALRPLAGDSKPSVCTCLIHQVPLADGDHTTCPVELLACPEHRKEQLRKMNALRTSTVHETQVQAENTTFEDAEGNPIAGFCLWCNRDFHSMKEVKDHNADQSNGCIAYQKFFSGKR
jgi:hypothetical protein